MKVSDRYLGELDPFLGDRALVLRILPAGARVTRATVTVKPSAYAIKNSFTERFSASGDAGSLKADDWGITGLSAATGSSTSPATVEVDFYGVQTLVEIAGWSSASTVTILAGMGPTYLQLADDGTFMAPGKTLLAVTFPADGSSVTVQPVTASKVKVLHSPLAPTDQVKVTRIGLRSTASNLSARLGKLAPFWVRPGALTAAATSTDFVDVLNAFLNGAIPVNGFHEVPLVLHTDTIARLNLDIDLEYVMQQPVLAAPLTEATLHFGLSTLPDQPADLMTVKLPRDAIPVTGATGAAIRGAIQPSRVADGPIGDVPTSDSKGEPRSMTPLPVATDSMLAQPFRIDSERAVSAIDLPLGNAAAGLAGINVGVRADLDGKPSNDVLASAPLQVGKPLPGESSWGSGTLATPFRALANTRYWLVVQSLNGPAQWLAQTADGAEPPMQRSQDNGFSWRAAGSPGVPPPLAGLFRLRDIPTSFTVPIRLQIGTGRTAQCRTFEEFAALGRIDFQFDFATKLDAYLAQAQATSPCAGPDLVANGTFDLPAPDDATRRLFGVDGAEVAKSQSIESVDLSQGADLSLERSITLASDTGPARIDCAGRRPAATSMGDIIDAINRVMPSVASPSRSGPQIELRSATSSLTLHPWARRQAPTGWQVPADEVCRVRQVDGGGGTQLVLAGAGVLASVVPFSPDVADAIESLGATTSLSQRISVAAGCAYVLEIGFRFGSSSPEGWPPWPPIFEGGTNPVASTWAMTWLDATGSAIRADGAALTPPSSPNGAAPLAFIGEQHAEIAITAPSGAVAADLAITNRDPDTYALILSRVSLLPTPSLVSGGRFRQWEQVGESAQPSGWMSSGGPVVPISRDDQVLGVALVAGGPDDTVLSQSLAVQGGERYELQVDALAASQVPAAASAAQPRPRVEIQWTGTPSPSVTSIPFDDHGFLRHAWAGDAPLGATSAALRLVQPRAPKEGRLLVESLSFRRIDLTAVPLRFLAEAPGELTVRNFTVTYDRPSLQEAPAWDGSESQVADVASGMPIYSTPSTSVEPRPVPVLTDINGIGPARAKRLEVDGIVSVAGLAAAKAEYLAGIFRGVSVEAAQAMIDAARQKTAEAAPPALEPEP